ncbi:MAG: DNA-processing protein DprA [Bacteroidota bacterium]|nr:DNA-processing protein DprA [Bacteroidota bacterium]
MYKSITDKDLLYKIALTLLPDVGDVIAKNLVTYCGSAEAVFKEKKKALIKIPGIANKTAENILAELRNVEILKRSEQEIQFIEENKIEAIFFTDGNYPSRLKFSNDSPALLYYKGNADLNTAKVVSVVGTRTPSSYGIHATEQFIDELSNSGILIVSGLAYGIDVLAHKTALDKGLDTIGVVAHGLDRIYPAVHSTIARKMEKQGGVLTDFISDTNPDRENFPKRNRIVAGICDALVVVETKLKGGSLITAEIANSYNKDVFAFPGRTGDEFSAGCNAFIKRNKAVLIENAADLLYVMNWQDENLKPNENRNKQIQLLPDLSAKEKKIVSLFSVNSGVHIDEVCYKTGLTMSDVASTLLQLEFSNVVKSLPGKMYSLL